MSWRVVPGARPRPRDGGAAAVEFALLFPLFLVIVFGIVNMGFGFNQKINLTQAARETSRYGATLSVAAAGGTTEWLNKVTAVAVSAAGGDNGDLADDRSGRYICVALITPASKNSKTTGTGGPAATAECYDDGRGDEARVQVVVKSHTVVDFVFLGGKITVGSESVTHYEATT